MTEDPNKNHSTPSFWLEALGSEVRYVDVDGARTRVIEAGKGEPIILLHGLSGHAETWIRNVAVLAEEFHVFAIDMLGHGFTHKPADGYSIALLADHVVGFMDAVDVERAALVGQSLGGWVGAWLAIHHPARVSAFVSVTGAGLELTPDDQDVTAKVGAQVSRATRKALSAPTLNSVRERLEWLMHDKSLVTDELVQTRYRIYSDPEFAVSAPHLTEAVTGIQSRAELLTSDRLAQITCPTLILWTTHNPTMPWEVGQSASRIISKCEFYLMADAGHWPQFEKPLEFHSVVLPFLRRLQVRGGSETGKGR